MINTRPSATEFNPYYARYIDAVPEGDLIETLRAQRDDTLTLVRSIPEDRAAHRYAPEKWTIRQVLLHVADVERVMGYRALRAARGDGTPLPGFDENAWAGIATGDGRTLASLASELAAVREATLWLLAGIDDSAAGRQVTANGNAVSVRALAWIIAGHERHHVRLLRERYL